MIKDEKPENNFFISQCKHALLALKMQTKYSSVWITNKSPKVDDQSTFFGGSNLLDWIRFSSFSCYTTLQCSSYPSYPFSSSYPRPGRRGCNPSRETRPPFSQPPSSAYPGEHRGIPRPTERHNLTIVSWVCPEASSQ